MCKLAKRGISGGPDREPYSCVSLTFESALPPLGTTTGPDFGEVGSSAGVADSGVGIGAAWGDYDGTVCLVLEV